MSHPTRMIYENTPAWIPVPDRMLDRKIEVIFWPLDESPEKPTPTLPGSRRRSPPAAFTGKVRELGNVMNSAPASDWGVDT